MSATPQRQPAPAADDADISYEDSKRLARSDDTSVRLTLAARDDIRPEVLYYLADDDEPLVRRALAANRATPRQADVLLARDDNDDVRATLADKIARLTPELTPDARDTIYLATVEALDMLAQDELARVRRIVAEVLSDVVNAPADVIRRLARDEDPSVARPILEFSPVLTDEDLLEVIASEPVQEALRAISRRDSVSGDVADAVVAAGDQAAVADLLSNQSAQIREDTLDQIIDAAPEVETWHRPLVLRPKLPGAAARKIARFVAKSLLRELSQREDLEAEALDAVAEIVEERIGAEPKDLESRSEGDDEIVEERVGAEPKDLESRPEGDDEPFDPGWDDGEREETIRARTLHEASELDAETISEALAAGDRAFAAAGMALCADVDPEVIGRAISLRSAKAVVALAWKAGFSARFALQLQLQLAGVVPDALLRPADDDAFPLTEEEMDWQLEFLTGTTG